MATRLAALAPVTSSPDRSNKRTAPLDLHRPLEYAKRCHGKILPWDENDPLPLLIPSLNKPVTQKRCTVDLSVHDKILWRACEVAHERSKSAVHNGRFHDPRLYYPLLVRGSWMNDVNQSTLLTDQVRTADQKVRELIYGFWCAYRNELMKSLRRSPSQAPFYPSVRKIYKQIFINGTEHIDDFGSYDPLDHLDVIPGGSILEDYRKEFPNDTGNGRISKTILDTYFALFNKLNNSYGSNRFDWLSLTSLGRALHTIADFYAHTNYVELLLWILALEPAPYGLNETIRRTFNCRRFDSEIPWQTSCPLPDGSSKSLTAILKKGGGLFYYAEMPQETDLVSSIFDTSDTICSLLGMYTSNLRKMERIRTLGDPLTSLDREKRESYFDGALAVIDLSSSQKRLITAGYKLVANLIEYGQDIGRSAREFLAQSIEQKASKLGKIPEQSKAIDALRLTASIVRSYDSKEGQDWRSAGYYQYVIQSLSNDMLFKLRESQRKYTPQLPNHTLLRKDSVPEGGHNHIRFNFACTLAVEASANILGWYFSERQEDTCKNPSEILGNFMNHPSKQGLTKESCASLSTLVSELNGPMWTDIPHPCSMPFSRQQGAN